MHGLETPPKDPAGTITSALVVILILVAIGLFIWDVWKAIQ